MSAQVHRLVLTGHRRWCSCGAPWINGHCARMTPNAGPIWPQGSVSVVRSGRRRLHWGPFAVSLLTTGGANLLLLAGAFALLDLQRLWAALLAVLLVMIDLVLSALFVASGVAALLGRKPKDPS